MEQARVCSSPTGSASLSAAVASQRPIVLPQSPGGFRPNSARRQPQSGRYAQEALAKLNDDVLRSTSALGRSQCDSAMGVSTRCSPLPGASPTSMTSSPHRSRTPLPGDLISKYSPIAGGVLSPVTAKASLFDSNGKACVVADMDLLREVFREEARGCLADMQTVVGDHDGANAAWRLEQWRQVDLKASVQLQHHVKELTKVNRSLEEFIVQDCSILDFKEFARAMVSSVDEMVATRKEYCTNCDYIAERAASSAIASLEQKKVQHWKRHWDQQHEQEEEAHQRWVTLHARLDELYQRVDAVDEQVKSNRMQVKESNVAQGSANIELEAVVKAGVQEINRATFESMERSADALRTSFGETMDSLRRHVTALTTGSEEDIAVVESLERGDDGNTEEETVPEGHAKPGAAEPIGAEDARGSILRAPRTGRRAGPLPLNVVIKNLDDRLCHWESTSLREVTRSREMAESCQSASEEAKRQREQAEALNEQSRAELGRLGREIEDFKQKLTSTQTALDTACAAPAKDVMTRLKEIETRGHVRVNRQNGEMEIVALKAVDFLARKPSEQPNAEFKDASSADLVLQDIAEVSGMFNVPMEIDVHMKCGKGGTPAFWNSLAGSRADVIRQTLGRLGVPGNLVTGNGEAETKDTGHPALAIRLDRSLFPVEEDPGAAKARGKSPAGKKK